LFRKHQNSNNLLYTLHFVLEKYIIILVGVIFADNQLSCASRQIIHYTAVTRKSSHINPAEINEIFILTDKTFTSEQ
jgi:hypothetical protein